MKNVRIDIVSDVVCPWCIIGYKRLEQALMTLSDTIEAEIHWHPFELNPAMKPEGQNLREHLADKYGTSLEASIAARQTITDLGQELGFEFNFTDEMRIYNTRKAHQLLLWSQSQGLQLDLEIAMFHAYFTDGKDVSDTETLLDIAESLGLNRVTCQAVLSDTSWKETVSSTEQQWLEAGINAVPAIIIDRKHLISGAQSSEMLVEALQEITHQQNNVE
ncbi:MULTISPECIES: DsbA family oxidoreductase [Vibrio]|uniref:DsbA family oxidoreductase n=1 Tax=Vibrio TaxID=662 RepID=UPI0020753426|nr:MULTISPECIES: DsbA family oxidoreductase [Vibrio]USD35123.1 DsbA family oxidoreductase [Vibrio sp. SCSIO 43186]USD48189.1 DsbA family oxidoreductase [Vibrio sp. SCSIO 43145]USD72248.1 DsbA family oxidoreductase [Vibrio sp. SCSIO 43139]USD97923.1 disulfide bond formation protein DsbA [Vibrio coralliilyticus]